MRINYPCMSKAMAYLCYGAVLICFTYILNIIKICAWHKTVLLKYIDNIKYPIYGDCSIYLLFYKYLAHIQTLPIYMLDAFSYLLAMLKIMLA